MGIIGVKQILIGTLTCILVLQGVLAQDYENVPDGAASLAFVFDITGSMYDDLVQVIEGAAKILATTLSRREQPLYNYVLVPFHDPGMSQPNECIYGKLIYHMMLLLFSG